MYCFSCSSNIYMFLIISFIANKTRTTAVNPLHLKVKDTLKIIESLSTGKKPTLLINSCLRLQQILESLDLKEHIHF